MRGAEVGSQHGGGRAVTRSVVALLCAANGRKNKKEKKATKVTTKTITKKRRTLVKLSGRQYSETLSRRAASGQISWWTTVSR